MPQGLVPFKYEVQARGGGMMAMAGLPAYLDLAHVAELRELIERDVRVRRQGNQGWTDAQVVLSLVLLNLAGGDCVDDLRILEGDEGFCRVLQRIETYGMRRRERRRAVPSPSSVFRVSVIVTRHGGGEKTEAS